MYIGKSVFISDQINCSNFRNPKLEHELVDVNIKWFEDYKWLHYDKENDYVLCFYCYTHQDKLTTENNKDPAYISVGFKNWKKAPSCFKEHKKSKCQMAVLSYQTVIPHCKDPKEMISTELVKKRERERLYLTIIMDTLQASA